MTLPPFRQTLRTDFGDFDLPPNVAAAYAKAKYRKDRQPDQRTTLGRQLRAYEKRQHEQLRAQLALGPGGKMMLESDL